MLLTLWLLLQTTIVSPQAPAVLEIRVSDAATGRLTSCNILVTDPQGRTLTAPGPSAKGLRSDGNLRLELPAGPARVRVTRGFETRAAERNLLLTSGATVRLDLELTRLVDLRSLGWYSGDSHAHMIHGERHVVVGFDDVALAARAEDLQLLSLSHAWNLEDANPESLEAELKTRSTLDSFLTWNLEAPKNYYKGDATRCLGHCWNLGISGRTADQQDVIQLLLASSAHDYEIDKPSHANFESHRLIHNQGGRVFYTHPLRWWFGEWGGRAGYPDQPKARISNLAVELPLDVLLGPTFDGLDVITGTGESNADEHAFQLWCLLLNQGYRLAATGSSDSCFDRPGGALPGAARTYTFLPTGFSMSGVGEATARGATFATTGPLLLVAIDDRPPGTQFIADGTPHKMVIQAFASGEDPGPLSAVEIVRNGKPFRRIAVEARSWRHELEIREEADTWYSVRAWGSNREKQRAVSGAFFFSRGEYQPPSPVPASALLTVLDAVTGKRLSGTATEVQYSGTLPADGKSQAVAGGQTRLVFPGTSRIRVDAPGYVPQTLSPFLDNPELLQMITALEAEDILNWETFERIRHLLSEVELTFRLRRDAAE
jgi:hypothetical protein